MPGFIDSELTPLGYAQDTSISTASALPSIPTKARVAIIQAAVAELRWTDDGSTPTASLGMILAVGESMLYTGTDLATIKVISATGEVNVTYYV